MATKRRSERGIVDAAARAAQHVEALGLRCALVGGLAVGARAEPRYTRDVDLAVAVDGDADAERVIHALAAAGYLVEAVVEQSRTGRLATARLRHRAQPEVFIDLLFASSGAEPDIVSRAEVLSYGRGVRLPVAMTGDLLALKVLSESDERLQDRIDLQALSRLATAEDWRLAESTARLIRARGFHRGRALVRRLRRWRR